MQAWEEKRLSLSGLSVEAASNYASVKLVENGAGIALLPQTAIHQEWPTGVRALDLEQHTFQRDFGSYIGLGKALSNLCGYWPNLLVTR